MNHLWICLSTCLLISCHYGCSKTDSTPTKSTHPTGSGATSASDAASADQSGKSDSAKSPTGTAEEGKTGPKVLTPTPQQARGMSVAKLLNGEIIVADGFEITAEPKRTELQPDNPEQRADDGHKLVVINTVVTSRKPDIDVGTTQFGLLAKDGEILKAWGEFGPFLPGGPVQLIRVEKFATKTSFSKPDANVSIGLVFMIPADSDVRDFNLVWDLVP